MIGCKLEGPLVVHLMQQPVGPCSDPHGDAIVEVQVRGCPVGGRLPDKVIQEGQGRVNSNLCGGSVVGKGSALRLRRRPAAGENPKKIRYQQCYKKKRGTHSCGERLC